MSSRDRETSRAITSNEDRPTIRQRNWKIPFSQNTSRDNELIKNVSYAIVNTLTYVSYKLVFKTSLNYLPNKVKLPKEHRHADKTQTDTPTQVEVFNKTQVIKYIHNCLMGFKIKEAIRDN